MVNVKKKKYYLCYFVILLTFTLIASCKSKINHLYEIQGKQININNSFETDTKIEAFVSPYKNHINKDLDSILAYNPITQDKSKGKWETNIGNLFAETTLLMSNPIFQQRENKTIDICILNHGGIRAVIPKGNVTSRTAYEIMPFENSVVVLALDGKAIVDLANYMILDKKPHPLAGIKIFLEKDEKTIKRIEINQQPLDENKIYYVITSDYLANGGDNMNFLKSSSKNFDLDYKLRNIFIDYFKRVDSIPNLTEPKIIIE